MSTRMAQDGVRTVGLIAGQPGEPAGVRELTPSEIDEVSGGGVLGGLGIFAAGVAAGVVSNWIWDRFGDDITEGGEWVYGVVCGRN